MKHIGHRKNIGHNALGVLLLLLLEILVVAQGYTDVCVVKVLSNGVGMPYVGFGTAAMRGQSTVDAVTTAISAGFRHFDGAQAKEWYDDVALGQALQDSMKSFQVSREEVFLATKLHPRSFGTQSTREAIQSMSRDLQVDYIDLVILHFPSCGNWIPGCVGVEVEGTWREAWRELESLYEKGTIRAIGVSNFDIKLLVELWDFATVKPHVVQNWFDPFHQDAKVLQYCEEHDIAYVAYSTLGGQWNHREGINRNLVMESDLLMALAQKYQVSITTLVLSWALQRGVIVLPRSMNPEHIRHNAKLVFWDAFANPLISEQDMMAINALDNSFDMNENCAEWAAQGECDNNPAYMLTSCSLSCSSAAKNT